MASHRFQILDVFTQVRFGGNQLAVVLDADDIDGATMQKIAREFNFSETTFICRPKDAGNTAHVRIFTPAAELPFAGHPIVGTALVLARLHKTDAITMEIKAGLVPVAIDGDHATFTAPVLPSPAGKAPDDATLAAAVSLKPEELGFDGHRPAFVAAGNVFLFVPVRDLDAVAKSRIDATYWPKVKGGHNIVGAYVYTRGGADAGTSYRVRLYAPDHGIAEDPATGSAAATLPGQIAASEALSDGSHRWQLEQGYEMARPSQITVDAEVSGGKITTVRVGGSAVVTASGIIES